MAQPFLGGSTFSASDTWQPEAPSSNSYSTPSVHQSIQSIREPVASEPAQRHSTASFFHLLFKGGAVVTYLFCTLMTDNFILSFVLCALFLAFDFWTVKNVTGRLLVGLRWWNEVNDEGVTKWIFESKREGRQVDNRDALVFWLGLYVTPLIWIFLGFSSLTSPKWLLIVTMALILNGSNVVGFWKCQTDAKKQLQIFIASRF